MEMQVAEEDPGEPAWWNVDKKLQDAVVWPLVVTKPLSTSLTPPPSPLSSPYPPSPPSPSPPPFRPSLCQRLLLLPPLKLRPKRYEEFTFSDRKHLVGW